MWHLSLCPTLIIFLLLFLKQGLTLLRLALNLVYSWGWIWIPDSPCSTFQMLGLQVCTTTSRLWSTEGWTQGLEYTRWALYTVSHTLSPSFNSCSALACLLSIPWLGHAICPWVPSISHTITSSLSWVTQFFKGSPCSTWYTKHLSMFWGFLVTSVSMWDPEGPAGPLVGSLYIFTGVESQNVPVFNPTLRSVHMACGQCLWSNSSYPQWRPSDNTPWCWLLPTGCFTYWVLHCYIFATDAQNKWL